MPTPLMTLMAILALAGVYVLAPIAANVFARYRRARTLRCPEAGLLAEVKLDARHAALTAVTGAPALRVEDCSLWPGRAGCAQACARPGV